MSQDSTHDPWRLSGEGMLIWRDTGHKAFRIDASGTMWIWDKKTKQERALTLDDLQKFIFVRQAFS